MAAADYRLMTEATGQRIAVALENLAGFGNYLTTSDVVDDLDIDDATGEKVAGQHEVYQLNSKIEKESFSFYGVYPNGKLYNQTDFLVTIPCWNPEKKSVTINQAYIYGTGGFVDIKSGLSIEEVHKAGIIIRGVFDSARVGQMLRIDCTISS